MTNNERYSHATMYVIQGYPYAKYIEHVHSTYTSRYMKGFAGLAKHMAFYIDAIEDSE